MKKILSFFALSLFTGLLTCGIFVLYRYSQNPEQIVPFPYYFLGKAPTLALEAPIVITGDKMGAEFGKYHEELSATISKNLEKPIKIQVIAKKNFGLHRTLHELGSFTQWPQILIYQGGSEEFLETKFYPTEIPTIAKNFSLYLDERIETFLVLYPWLSRIVYTPMKRIPLSELPELGTVTENDYLTRLETELMLYEQQLIQMVNQSKDRNTLLILVTTPLNLDIPPKKVCHFSSTTDIDAEILKLKELMDKKNHKSAYSLSSKLIKQFSANAQIQYLHGQISKRLGHIEEAKTALLESSAYDCLPWRATEVHNSIIRKVAREHKILLFDFAKLVEKDWAVNSTFFDETIPQNLYYEKAMTQLGLVIKNILKL